MADSPSYIQESNELVSLALDQAKLILRFGPSQQKIQVIRSVLGVIARQAAAGQDATAAEMRAKMETLLSSMRNVPMLDKVVTDEEIIDVEVVDE
jgi:hypothetical protein